MKPNTVDGPQPALFLGKQVVALTVSSPGYAEIASTFHILRSIIESLGCTEVDSYCAALKLMETT